jgi:hypothetical protein
MIRLRRTAAFAVVTLAALPVAAHAAVTCPVTQPGVNAWAGSPKTLTFVPCTSDVGPVTYAVVAPLAAKGTASTPAVDGTTFVFTGTFNPNGSDPTGADTVNLSATDGSITPGAVSIPISIGPAPVIDTTFTGKDVFVDAPLQDGRRTYDVFYKTVVTATSNLSDPTPPYAPLAAFSLRFRSGVGINLPHNTNGAGNAIFTARPLVTDEYDFDVPSLPGTFHDGFVLWIAPDWKIASRFPVKKRKYVISGRLLANKSARTKGSFVSFQRLKGKKWITVIRKVPVSTAMTFSVKVSRSAFVGKTVRFYYTSKNIDYIDSFYRFKIVTKRSAAPAARISASATGTSATRGLHR